MADIIPKFPEVTTNELFQAGIFAAINEGQEGVIEILDSDTEKLKSNIEQMEPFNRGRWIDDYEMLTKEEKAELKQSGMIQNSINKIALNGLYPLDEISKLKSKGIQKFLEDTGVVDLIDNYLSVRLGTRGGQFINNQQKVLTNTQQKVNELLRIVEDTNAEIVEILFLDKELTDDGNREVFNELIFEKKMIVELIKYIYMNLYNGLVKRGLFE